MSDENRGIGGTVGPPWSVDLLADLHAGVLDEAEAAQLWPRVNADPEARAILEALDATQADLSALAEAPVEPMPAEYAARLDAALAAEAATLEASGPRQDAPFPAQAPAPAEPGTAPVVDLAAARQRRNRRLGWSAGILTAAAAAIVAVVLTVPGGTTGGNGTPNVAAPAPPAPSGPSIGGNGSGAEALLGKGLGIQDYGPLQDQGRLSACLAANGFDPDVRPDGVRPVNVDGKSGVLVIFTTGKLAQYRMVAFGADCGPGHPDKLFDKVVGEK